MNFSRTETRTCSVGEVAGSLSGEVVGRHQRGLDLLPEGDLPDEVLELVEEDVVTDGADQVQPGASAAIRIFF